MPHSIGSKYFHDIRCIIVEVVIMRFSNFSSTCKTVTAGGGGMVLTNDDDLAKKSGYATGMERNQKF